MSMPSLKLERVLRDKQRDSRVVLVTINGQPWGLADVRKEHHCAICNDLIYPGDKALKPLHENQKRGVVRNMRVCLACTEGR